MLPLVEGVGGIAARAACAGSQVGKQVVSVRHAAPAPVEVVLPVAVVAVTHEGVSTALVIARVEHRPQRVEFGLYQIGPLVVRVAAAVDVVQGRVVAKILYQCVLRAGSGGTAGHIGAAGVIVVIHLHGHAAVVHQGGHSRLLRVRRGSRQRVGHVVPVVGGGSKVGAQCAVLAVGIAVASSAVHRMLPVFHHLRHGRHNAAGGRARVVLRVEGAQGVVVGRLVPRCVQQRRRRRQRMRLQRAFHLQQLLPFGGGRLVGLPVVGAAPLNLFLVAAQPVAHIGVALDVERVVERIAQHRTHAVLGGHNHKALAVAVGEDIHAVERCRHRRQVALQGFHIEVAVHVPEVARHALRLVGFHGRRRRRLGKEAP